MTNQPLTDEELAALTDLANLAQPYTAEEQTLDFVSIERNQRNADFFNRAYQDVPRLIAEVDAKRQDVAGMLGRFATIDRKIDRIGAQNQILRDGLGWLDQILSADLVGGPALTRACQQARMWREVSGGLPVEAISPDARRQRYTVVVCVQLALQEWMDHPELTYSQIQSNARDYWRGIAKQKKGWPLEPLAELERQLKITAAYLGLNP